mgnify:CR=1 FL=1
MSNIIIGILLIGLASFLLGEGIKEETSTVPKFVQHMLIEKFTSIPDLPNGSYVTTFEGDNILLRQDGKIVVRYKREHAEKI